MSIQNRLIVVISSILVLIILISGTFSYVQTKGMVSTRLYESELPATVNSIRNDIEKKLGIYLTASQAIADNTFILDWFKSGENEDGIAAWSAYATKVKERVGAFSVTMASNETHKYYDQAGYNDAASGGMKYWFYDFLKRGQEYEVVLDKNETTGNAYKMFTNVRVDVGGKLASVGLGIDAEELAAEISNIKVGESGHVFLTNADGVVKIHKNSEYIGEMNILEEGGISDVADQLLTTTKGNSINLAIYDGGEGQMIAASSWIPTIQSFVVVEVPAAEVFGEITNSMIEIGLVVLVILGVAVLAVVFVARQISSPIVTLTNVVNSITDGDVHQDVPAQDRKDEVGAIAKAVEVFRQGILQKNELEQEQKEAALRAEEEKAELLTQMADDFERSVGGIVEHVSTAAGELNSAAQSMSTISDDASEQATVVSAASEEASVNVQTVASATEELNYSISEISSQVEQSANVARGAVAQAEASQESIQELITAAQKIGEVVSLITDIADQTNLLALNATIEAARAGDAGKGFAVVASEVKSLATQTGNATEEIRAQVEGIQSSTKQAAASIGEIGETITQIDEIASSVASAVDEQNSAAKEIARNIEQASVGTREVSSSIVGVTKSATEVGSVSSEVLSASQELGQNSETLKAQVANFLAQVRTG